MTSRAPGPPGGPAVTAGGLLVTLLAVSCASLTVQSAALIHQVRQRASYHAERIAGHGLVRAAATRTFLATLYTASAALALAGVRIPGAGTLGPEALLILIVAQGAWLYNAGMDVRIRRRLRNGGAAAQLERKP